MVLERVCRTTTPLVSVENVAPKKKRKAVRGKVHIMVASFLTPSVLILIKFKGDTTLYFFMSLILVVAPLEFETRNEGV
jgi:hypothetical protein